MDELATRVAYFQAQQVSRQWRGFLSALAEEFEDQLGVSELRSLAARIGERFARANVLPECETLDELNQAINDVWMALDWGYVSIDDDAEHLAIRHACAPLHPAFGDEGMAWAPAFLEGVYQHWFSVLGIDPALRVREVAADEDGVIAFHLRR